jgi:hypothetical protein
MTSITKHFEIWQSTGECIATTVCQAGPNGDQCRSMLEPGSTLVFKYEARSEMEMMQHYYDFMGFGIYRSEWPDLAARPYGEVP